MCVGWGGLTFTPSRGQISVKIYERTPLCSGKIPIKSLYPGCLMDLDNFQKVLGEFPQGSDGQFKQDSGSKLSSFFQDTLNKRGTLLLPALLKKIETQLFLILKMNQQWGSNGMDYS